MRDDTSTAARLSHSRGSSPDTVADPVSDLPLPVPNTARAREAAAAAAAATAAADDPTTGRGETRGEHFRRKALRGRLHGYAIATVALVAVLIALAASNTARVKVNWLIGTSHV
jgi:hypothetical protein